MKLFVWRPDGHGPLSFFVAAESQEQAEESVRKYINDEKIGSYDRGGWPNNFELEIYNIGEVAANNNS